MARSFALVFLSTSVLYLAAERAPYKLIVVGVLQAGFLVCTYVSVRQLKRYCTGNKRLSVEAHWVWPWDVAGYAPDAKGEYPSDGEVLCRRHRDAAVTPVDPNDYPNP